MLVGAGVRAYAGPVRAYGAALIGTGDRCTIQPGGRRNGLLDAKAGLPYGYRHPGAWVLPQKAGALASTRLAAGSGTLTGAGAMGVNGTATLDGAGDLTALGALIVSAAPTIAGTGDLTAAAVAFLNAAATLAGSGDLSGAVDAVGWAVALAEGTSDLTVTETGVGTMAATIDVAASETLTAGAVAHAVWASPEGAFLIALSRNKVITDPAAGTYTVYAEDGTTPLYVADLWQDAAGTTPYAGAGADRRDRLT
jgi:hypothetical protein